MTESVRDRDLLIFKDEASFVSTMANAIIGENGCIEDFHISEEKQMISMTLLQPVTNERFYLDVDCTDYRRLPPKFSFSSSPGLCTNLPQDYPKQVDNPFGGGPLFILTGDKKNGCVCGHFNRLAYQELNGPHGNWGGPGNWLNASKTGNEVRATNLADMFSVVISRFKLTRGRLNAP